MLFVGDLSCPELTSTGFLFEQQSTGATARRSDCLPANGYFGSLINFK
ncbi:MAG: hypothetical protein LBT09_00765 [Planctomycetaceae bacterium]|nr:hypothetical protein [Planctomycetaceae bacterium]